MRFFIAILYILSDFSNSIIYSTFTTIAPELVKIYGKEPIIVNLPALVFLFVTPFVTFIGNFWIDKYGMGSALRIGVSLTLVGGWIRLLVNNAFEFVILGNFLGAIGAPFIYNSKTKVAANWFK